MFIVVAFAMFGLLIGLKLGDSIERCVFGTALTGFLLAVAGGLLGCWIALTSSLCEPICFSHLHFAPLIFG